MLLHIHHADVFFPIYEDFKKIGQRLVGRRADLFATTLHVFDLLRKEQVERLLGSGVCEKDLTEEMLGFPATWKAFSERAGRYSRRSFESILEPVLSAGLVHRLYVECHRRKPKDGRERLEMVCDEAGQPILHATIDEARANRRVRGTLVNFFYVDCQAVNDLIAEIYGLHVATPQDTKNGDAHDEAVACAESERTPQGDSIQAGAPKKTIAQPSQTCTGTPASTPTTQPSQTCETSSHNRASTEQPPQDCEPESGKSASLPAQNCECNPRKLASAPNKNNDNKNQESLKETNTISASRAVVLSSFDFSQAITPDAIKQLARSIYAPLPAHYRVEADKEAAYAKIDAAAQTLAALPMVAELGLRRFAARMAYQADEASPCAWRAYCRALNPGFVPRLWHLASEPVFRRMSQEMEANNWWPEDLPQAPGLTEEPPAIDLAALAGIPQADRVGMNVQTAQAVADALKAAGMDVTIRRVGGTDTHGYMVELWFASGASWRALNFYRVEDMDIIASAEEQAPFGSPEFVQSIAQALRDRHAA